MAPAPKKTILITGCSDGGLGSALALAFHADGHYRVFATARTPTKMTEAKAAGIELLSLDVQDKKSIEKCVEEVKSRTGGSLDILVNNAGMTYYTALTDASIDEAKKLFDLNVWAPLAMIQMFLPLLLKSSTPLIVNHTSIASVMIPPFMSLYGASKSAIGVITEALRHELTPFGVKVLELKTGNLHSNIHSTHATNYPGVQPQSLYWPARPLVDVHIKGETMERDEMPAAQWATNVVAQVSKANPPASYWYGGNAWLAWFGSCMPMFMQRYIASDYVKLPAISKTIRDYGVEKTIAEAYKK